MPAQTPVFSEQFTSTCVFRTIGLLECFTLSLGWQWSALSTLFPGLDFLTAFSLSLSSHPSESSSLPLPLSGLHFLWVRFPHSVTQSFFTQSSLLNLFILISQVSLSLSLSLVLAPIVPHSRSLNLELPELFVRLLTRSCSCSRSLPHARARSLSLDLELLS